MFVPNLHQRFSKLLFFILSYENILIRRRMLCKNHANLLIQFKYYFSDFLLTIENYVFRLSLHTIEIRTSNLMEVRLNGIIFVTTSFLISYTFNKSYYCHIVCRDIK